MSSTENTADVTQQPDEAPSSTPAPAAVTPEAGTPAAPEPANATVADPTEDAPAAPAGDDPVGGSAAEDATEVPGTAEVVAAADVPADGDLLDVSETADTTDALGSTESGGDSAEVPSGAAVTESSDAVVSPATPTTDPTATDPTATAPTATEDSAADPAVTEAVTADAPTAEATTPEAAETEAAGAPAAATPHAPAVPTPLPAAPASDPTLWGRVDDEGTVYVRTTDGGERAVGNWQAGEPADGLAHYGRRYDDLATEVGLLEARLRAHTGNPAEIRAKAQALAEQVPTADVVGDLPALASRLGTIIDASEAAAAVSRAEKAQARAAQIARKEALAVEAEQIGADSTQWKAAGDRLKAIVEEWKTIKGIDRKTDEALWTRFAAARDAFGRRRGSHFAALDVQRSESRGAKSALIAEAEKLATSTEWGPTSAAMRGLMDRWKAVPRTGRDTDDDLWKKFRAAQDVFFAARAESDKARTSEQKGNQEQKEALLAEAERIDPSRDLRGAQNALRKIQERYDAIGHVPREVMRALEDRMQAVEEKVRGAADAGRPSTVAENPMLTSLRAAATKAEEQLAKARAAGDTKRIADAEANLASRREFLAAAEKAGSGRR